MNAANTLTYLNDVLQNIQEAIESATGLKIGVEFSIFDHMNEPARVSELTRAAQALNWKRAENCESIWYKTGYPPSRVILFTNEDAETTQ